MKHRLTGGWWFNSNAGEWVRAGPSVRHYITSNQFLATLYGWTTRDEHQSGMINFPHKRDFLGQLYVGSIKLKPQKRTNGKLQGRVSIPWGQTKASQALNANDFQDVATKSFDECIEVVARSDDECKVGHWIFAESSATVCHSK